MRKNFAKQKSQVKLWPGKIGGFRLIPPYFPRHNFPCYDETRHNFPELGRLGIFYFCPAKNRRGE